MSFLLSPAADAGCLPAVDAAAKVPRRDALRTQAQGGRPSDFAAIDAIDHDLPIGRDRRRPVRDSGGVAPIGTGDERLRLLEHPGAPDIENDGTLQLILLGTEGLAGPVDRQLVALVHRCPIDIAHGGVDVGRRGCPEVGVVSVLVHV